MHLLFCSCSFTTEVWTSPDIPGLSLHAASGPSALIGTFIAKHRFLMIFCAAPCLLWNCSIWRSPSWSLRGIALQLTAFPVQSKYSHFETGSSGSHFRDEVRANFTQLLCDSCSSMLDTVHSSSEVSGERQYSLNLSCDSMSHSWTHNILMSSVTGWPHRSSSTDTRFHCQPLAHLLLPTFISLKLLPQCPVFIDLSEQPFGLSHGLVIGHRPPPTTAGGWIYLAADAPPTCHPWRFRLICWTPTENTFLYQQQNATIWCFHGTHFI